MASRPVVSVRDSRPTLEGAGVHLRRVFGFGAENEFDPFLLLDDFRGDHPDKYSAGFPWHPHRGIETITYMIEGECDHGDSMGNDGTIFAGDVQWMTAGSGIVHQEMPRGGADGHMGGFQLWANLPASDKMRNPQYMSILSSDIPEVRSDGVRVRVIAGKSGETAGPVSGIAIEPEYLDVSLDPGAEWLHPTPPGSTTFAFLFEGAGGFGEPTRHIEAGHGRLILFGDGESVTATGGELGARFLLISGKPLREPIAWRGPIVMNTTEELQLAWKELDEGTFIKDTHVKMA